MMTFIVLHFTNLLLAFILGYIFSKKQTINFIQRVVLPKTKHLIDNSEKVDEENLERGAAGLITGRMAVVEELMEGALRPPFAKKHD